MVTASQQKNDQSQGNYDICPVSAVFETEVKAKEAVQQLLDQGVSREDISVVGRNFQSESRISGFITRKDLILDGLKNGAIFGSLFGSFLSLLTGVGVLFIPFVGSVVAAGPLGAALLGAVTGAIAGGTGGSLASALASLGMPEEKAAIYETRLKAGEFLLVAETSTAQSEEVQALLQAAGGEEILACSDMKIPRENAQQIQSAADLSPEIRAHLSETAQQTFVETYSAEFEHSSDSGEAMSKAWQKVEAEFERDQEGVWKAPAAT
ncbi:MAG: hypothetical protein HC886_22890 [Leptolyngbyaceae cyanobacterium SM1_1_3]|nr:hypothetical protein [Leptolyngbyaceae cyanobacterium SM1_1_3]NJN03268.1 hypothetical protein [Leptolyngbyaceae cyanobacterium RM1_1_2]